MTELGKESLWRKCKKEGRTITAQEVYDKGPLAIDHAVSEGYDLKSEFICHLAFDMSMADRNQKSKPVWYAVIGNPFHLAQDRTMDEKRAMCGLKALGCNMTVQAEKEAGWR